MNNRSRLNKSGHFGEFSSDRRHINRSNVEILRKGGVLNLPTRSATIWNANAMYTYILAKKKSVEAEVKFYAKIKVIFD